MTLYNKEIEYVKTNWQDEKTIKPSEIKKTKLENQGYNLISTQSGLFTGLMVYKNSNYKMKGKNETTIKLNFHR